LEIGLVAVVKESRLCSDKNRGRIFPVSDTEDRSRGARFIPDEVILLRREGWDVQFVQGRCSPCCWYWEFVDKKGDLVRIYHWEEGSYVRIGEENSRRMEETRYKRSFYDKDDNLCEDGPGPCPHCGNTNVRGGRVIIKTAEKLREECEKESEKERAEGRSYW
jgi:hypothetical protein